jgi:hypothetical protein
MIGLRVRQTLGSSVLVWALVALAGCGAVNHSNHSAASATQNPPPGAIVENTCPSKGPASETLKIATKPGTTYFDSDCYYALANTPLTILFLNQTVTESGKPVSLSIAAYPNQEAAYSIIDNGGGEDIHVANALWRSPDVLSTPDAQSLSVPTLKAGTYWVQWDGNPDFMHAFLIVE